MGSLLFDDDQVLLVGRKLATIIGLNEAMVVQQVHYWVSNITKSSDVDYQQSHYVNGRFWTRNTYDEWKEQFPFWSIPTIKRAVANAEKSGYLLSGTFNKIGHDRTKWYTVDYDRIYELEDKFESERRSKEAEKRAQAQQLQESIKMIRPKVVSKRYALMADQIDPTYTKDFNTKSSLPKTSSKASSQKMVSDHDDAEVELQVMEWCLNNEVVYDKEIADIINLFVHKFEERYKVPHKHIRQRRIGRIIKGIIHGFDDTLGNHVNWRDIDLYDAMIDRYFEIDSYMVDGKKCDHRIYHFIDDDVRRILYEQVTR